MKRKKLEIIVQSAKQTQQAAKILAKEIIQSRPRDKKALIIGLEGDLGSGKTTFIQGLAQGLGIKEKIASPTFVILKKYNIPNKNVSGFRFQVSGLYHIDCYRINHQDLLELDFKEIINQPQNIIAIEWAERVKKILPKNALWLKFDYLGKNKRRIMI
ncbi:MAG: tRNA (adenosine(37)-N6)-threonylcarbamoyltransferase complex ATPase subunit type 1 TsaE [Patescibacteria group bacterium]